MSNREAADQYREKVIAPLQLAKDHMHWRAVCRRDTVAGYLEAQLEADLRMAYSHVGAIARGEA